MSVNPAVTCMTGPADVAQRDQERRLRLDGAKLPHRVGFVAGLRGCRHLRNQPREMAFWLTAKQTERPVRIGAHQVEKIKGRFRDAEQDGLDQRKCRDQCPHCAGPLRR